MTTIKPDIKKDPAPWKPGQAHPERKPRAWGGFSERVREQQQRIERDEFGRVKRGS